MAGLNQARKNNSRGESRLEEAQGYITDGFNKGIKTYKGVADEYSPYMELGEDSATALRKLFSDPQGYLNDPAVKARQATQMESVQNSAAARGSLFGGGTLVELVKKGGEFASAELDKAASRYMGGVQAGLEGVKGYDAAKYNVADMQIGKGMAIAGIRKDMAQIDLGRAAFGAGMFSSWFGGSGPFGSATAGGMGGGGS